VATDDTANQPVPGPDSRLLVPIDVAELPQAALETADAMIRDGQGTLTLLYVQVVGELHVMDFAYTDPPEKTMAVRRAAEGTLEYLANRLQTPRERVCIEVVIGDPVEEIVKLSATHELILMSTHKRTKLTRFMLGSVAERVVRAARCSVLVLKPSR
jgi:nucleotide-binding universal stress UspA family protein